MFMAAYAISFLIPSKLILLSWSEKMEANSVGPRK